MASPQAAEAYLKWIAGNRLGHVACTMDGTPYDLMPRKREAAPGALAFSGGGTVKDVYVLPDGRAIAFPNVSMVSLGPWQARQVADNWERLIDEQVAASQEYRDQGFRTLEMRKDYILVEGRELPILVMPSFHQLADRGLQIRDKKNQISSQGSTLLFGNATNLCNEDHLEMMMLQLFPDIINAITLGKSLGADSTNLLIEDTAETPPHNRKELGMLETRKQRLRLFFYDFPPRTPPSRSGGLLNVMRHEEHGAMLREVYLENALSAIQAGVTIQEEKLLNREAADVYPRQVDRTFQNIKARLSEKLLNALAEVREPEMASDWATANRQQSQDGISSP